MRFTNAGFVGVVLACVGTVFAATECCVMSFTCTGTCAANQTITSCEGGSQMTNKPGKKSQTSQTRKAKCRVYRHSHHANFLSDDCDNVHKNPNFTIVGTCAGQGTGICCYIANTVNPTESELEFMIRDCEGDNCTPGSGNPPQ